MEEHRILEGSFSSVGLLHQAGFKNRDRRHHPQCLISGSPNPHASYRADWRAVCDAVGEGLIGTVSSMNIHQHVLPDVWEDAAVKLDPVTQIPVSLFAIRFSH